MRKNIETFALFMVCTIVFTALLLHFHKETPVEEKVLSTAADTVYDGCPAGFDLFESDEVRVCYPFEMEMVSGEKNASESDKMRTTFSSSNEELVISKNQNDSIPVHLCNFEEA